MATTAGSIGPNGQWVSLKSGVLVYACHRGNRRAGVRIGWTQTTIPYICSGITIRDASKGGEQRLTLTRLVESNQAA